MKVTHQYWRDLKPAWIWCWGAGIIGGLGSAGGMLELCSWRVFVQPEGSCDGSGRQNLFQQEEDGWKVM